MTMSAIYRENFEALKRLPLFESLVNEITRLKARNRILKEKNRALKSVIYTFPQVFQDRIVVENPVNIVIDKNSEQPTLCETVVNDDEDEVQIIAPEENENIIYDLTEEDDDTPPPRIVIKKEKNIIEDEVIDLAEAEEEEEADPEEEEEAEEEEDPTPTEEEEEEEAEEEEAEAEAEEEEEADEVFVITIKGKSYYTTNEKTGTIYAIDADEEVGAEVGVFVDGKAKFHKK